MIIEVKVPQLSESVSEAALATWKKKAGEAVARDENLIDIETDKVVLELPAPDTGVLIEIVKGDGESVVSNEVIARIDTEAQASTDAPKAAAAPQVPSSVPAAGIASPAARKILEEKGVAPADVPGTGRGGRVTKEDALSAKASAPSAAPASGPVAAAPAAKAVATALPTPPVGLDVIGTRPEKRVPMSRLRARIAERREPRPGE